MRDFSKMMSPLYSLLKLNNSTRTSSSGDNSSDKRQDHRYNPKQTISWNKRLQQIVDGMLGYLKSPKVIAFPNFEIPFFVNCESEGLGAVLYQTQDGINRVISYASRTLSESEKTYNLHSSKLEFLALKWATTERFSDYLKYGPPFTVYTDNNPLTYFLTTAKLNATGLRSVADLLDYNFTIKYRPGKINQDADYLSHRPLEIDEFIQDCNEECKPEIVSSVISAIDVWHIKSEDVSLCKLSAELMSTLPTVNMLDLGEGTKKGFGNWTGI